jgi:NTP pyrophosphatase (non-canonical NTP hydrolase)
MSVAQDSTVSEVSDELADVLIFIVAIANRYSIDLESAFRSKEEKNKRRTWV